MGKLKTPAQRIAGAYSKQMVDFRKKFNLGAMEFPSLTAGDSLARKMRLHLAGEDGKCVLCGDTQVIRSNGMDVACVCNILAFPREEEAEMAKYTTGVPPLSWDPGKPNAEAIRRFFSAFVKRPANAIAIGPTGRGKTTFMLLTLAALKPMAVFLPETALVEDRVDRDFVNGLIKTPPLLMIDDVGATQVSGGASWKLNALMEIINQRGNLGYPTMLSTNLSVSRLEERIGKRAMSRMTARGSHIFNFAGLPDIRREA